MSRTHIRLLLAAAVVGVAACTRGTEPTAVTEVVVGLLSTTPGSPALEMPDTVDVGLPFLVVVRTQGNGCHSAAGSDVRVAARVATVTPYDQVYRGVCTDILTLPARRLPVRFDEAGVGTVRAVGARGTVVERTVTIRAAR